MASDKQVRRSLGKRGDLTVSFDKGKVFGFTCLGMVLTAGGVVATLVPDPSHSDHTGVTIISAIYTVIMGGVTFGFIARLISSAPRLIINHQGIRINSLLLGVGIIEWKEVSGLVAYAAPLQTRLRIVLTDPRSILARQPWPQRLVYLVLKGNLMDTEAIVTSDALLPISTHELLTQIRERYHHELLHYHVVIRERQRK